MNTTLKQAVNKSAIINKDVRGESPMVSAVRFLSDATAAFKPLNVPGGDTSHRPDIKPDIAVQLSYILDITFLDAISLITKLEEAGIEIRWKAVKKLPWRNPIP
jgi:hypothetical protein